MIKQFSSYFGMCFFLCLCFMLPKSFTDKLREFYVDTKVPSFRKSSTQDREQLVLENTLLSEQLKQVREYLLVEDKIEKEAESRRELLQKRLQHLKQAKHARVIYRDPAFWSSLVWIDIGQKHGVQLNSPVVKGDVLVGIIDYVGKKRARVRLITDSTLSVSVRILRGAEQNHSVLEHLQALREQLEYRGDLFFSLEEQQNTLKILNHLEENLQGSVHDRYLAKGEVYGSSHPLWRSKRQYLKGIGFNYDYADSHGDAVDLRTEGLLQEGDLLVTTGMDGIFPEGFHVAIVEKVEPLQEGAVSYNLSARSLLQDLAELHQLSVLEPLPFDE